MIYSHCRMKCKNMHPDWSEMITWGSSFIPALHSKDIHIKEFWLFWLLSLTYIQFLESSVTGRCKFLASVSCVSQPTMQGFQSSHIEIKGKFQNGVWMSLASTSTSLGWGLYRMVPLIFLASVTWSDQHDNGHWRTLPQWKCKVIREPPICQELCGHGRT